MYNNIQKKEPFKDRKGNVDILRAFGIVTMIMGHVEFGGFFDKWIHAFHMPLWFVISGFFLNCEQDTGCYIYKKIKSLLLPYFGFGLFYEIIYSMLGNNQWQGLIFPNSKQIPLNGALWFLPALFVADIVVFIIVKYFSKFKSYLIMGIIGIIGSFHFIEIPFSIDSACVGIGFMLVGILLRRYSFLLELNGFFMISAFVIASGLIFNNEYVNMRLNQYSVIPMFWFNSILMIIAIWNLCIWIDRRMELRLIKEIGKNSLLYLCCNQFIIFILNKLICINSTSILKVLFFNCFKVVLIIGICFIGNRVIRIFNSPK